MTIVSCFIIVITITIIPPLRLNIVLPDITYMRPTARHAAMVLQPASGYSLQGGAVGGECTGLG